MGKSRKNDKDENRDRVIETRIDNLTQNNKDENRDRVIEARIDNLTETEQDNLREAMAKAKREHAPESRATIIEGTQKQLPGVKPKQLGE